MIIENLKKKDPFNVSKKEKDKFFLDQIKLLSKHHYKYCKIYKKIINSLKFNINNKNKLEDFPMIPVRLFKKFTLVDLDL